jgi:hypothetical protein
VFLMIIKKSAVAMAVASALGASSAFALPTNAAIDVQVIQMGSSAVFLPIRQVWADYCVAGTLTQYLSNDAAPAVAGSSYQDFSCTLSTKAPIPAALQGLNLLYLERETGGSVFGVNPVATSTPENYMNLSGCPSLASGTSLCTFTGTSLTSAIPDVGISDVEPKLFIPPNLPTTFPNALTTAQLGNLHIDPLLQQTFAVGVGSGVSGIVKNISSSQVASLMTGGVTDWHTINQGIAAGTLATVCLRTAGSGTQAAANALFLNNPCSPTGAKPLGAKPNIIFNSSTGAVLGCLDSHPNSVGIFSLADGPGAADTFSVVSVDNVAASAANSAIGAYHYFVESTLQFRNSTPAGNQLTLLQTLAKILSTPADLALVNAGLPNAALNAEQANSAASAPYAAGNPVEWGTRGGSTCAPYGLTFPL